MTGSRALASAPPPSGPAIPLVGDDGAEAALFVDPIRYNERRDQVYGTIFDWDEEGQLSPWPIEDRERVEERRQQVGLQPLAEVIGEMRARVVREGGEPPMPFADRQSEIRDWARRSGWLE